MKNIGNCEFYTRSKFEKMAKIFTKRVSNPGHPRDILNPIYYTILYYTILYYTILYYTILYYSIV